MLFLQRLSLLLLIAVCTTPLSATPRNAQSSKQTAQKSTAQKGAQPKPTPEAAKSSAVLVPTTFDKASKELGYDLDAEIWDHREDFLRGVDDNLKYLHSSESESAYKQVTELSKNITHERVEESLTHLRALLQRSATLDQFRRAVRNEFLLYRSTGKDGKGTVLFTGYYQPTFRASRIPTEQFKYPLYAAPIDFDTWKIPHPTRVELEGYEGKGVATSPLAGMEIAYLETRFDAFMVHVQGSAVLTFPDGSTSALGFAAGTKYPFSGIPKSFLKKYKIPWTKLYDFFRANPDALNELLAKNNRFIFFKENTHTSPIGSLGVPVIPERSIATDKSKLPPGAVGLIHVSIPTRKEDGEYELVRTTRLVLDQDTGSAIKGPGRVDIFMGTGPDAQARASATFAKGALYYLVLKKEVQPLRETSTGKTE